MRGDSLKELFLQSESKGMVATGGERDESLERFQYLEGSFKADSMTKPLVLWFSFQQE